MIVETRMNIRDPSYDEPLPAGGGAVRTAGGCANPNELSSGLGAIPDRDAVQASVLTPMLTGDFSVLSSGAFELTADHQAHRGPEAVHVVESAP